MILAAAGSTISLVFFLRFPIIAGNNGIAVFILVYVLCVILFGVPLTTAEFIVGRHTQTNTAQTYKKLTEAWLWRKIHTFGVIVGLFILCSYIVISGWALDYLINLILNRFNELALSSNENIYGNYFKNFVSNPYLPILYIIIFMLLTHCLNTLLKFFVPSAILMFFLSGIVFFICSKSRFHAIW